MVGELAAELEALRLGVGGALATLDQLVRNLDPGNAVLHEAERARRADEADRRDQRRLPVQALRRRLEQERLEAFRLEAELKLQELRARVRLLERPVDAVVVRGRARVLDRADEERRRRVDLAPGEVAPVPHRRG